MKKILFVCKHNIFRSRVAEMFFNKLNHNKNYNASSAGLIRWKKRDLKGVEGFLAEKKVAKKHGLSLKVKSKSINSSILKKTDILIIVANDVPASIFKKERSFNGKLIVWSIKDVKQKDKNKELVAEKTINFIENKVKNLVDNL